jgi:hypothetical protein
LKNQSGDGQLLQMVSLSGDKILSSVMYRMLHLFISPVMLILSMTSVVAQGPGVDRKGVADIPGVLRVRVTDSLTRQETPVRVRITHRNRVVQALPGTVLAVMYGVWDHADGFGYQPDSAFYSPGFFELGLPPGKYKIELSKGIEYLTRTYDVQVEKGKASELNFKMSRWINMPEKKWFSADDHIHIRRSPNENAILIKWLQAEDVHAGVILRMGDFWSTYYEQYGFGQTGSYQEGDYMITAGQEDPRTPVLGHALGLGASEKVRYQQDYYYYDRVFDKLHELDGVTGYAHQAESFHGYRGLMLDGLRKKVDALEILQFCVSEQPLLTRHYYHLLDLGYAVTAIAGSDFPWCGKDHDHGRPERNARIGNARFYTYLPGAFSFQTWKTALKKGNTFVTSGPMLDLKVNDKLPGDTVTSLPGSTIKVIADSYGHPTQTPLQRLELVMHGNVIATVKASDLHQSSSHLRIEMNMQMKEGFWIIARSFADAGQAAHTTPIYVTTVNGEFHNKKTVDHYLALAETYLKELEADLKNVSDHPEHQSWRYSKGIQKRIEETREVIKQLREKYGK